MITEFNFTLGFYAGFPENTVNPLTMETEKCSSGHYAFCTTMQDPSEYCVFQKISVLEGNVVDQVVVTFQDILVTNAIGYIKFEIDKQGLVSTEILMPDIRTSALTFSIEVVAVWEHNQIAEPDLNSFFTDSNSLELVERFADGNKTIPEQTYPVQTLVGIQNKAGRSMTVVVGQQHGATAKPDRGQIEVFVQRKMKGFDKGGIGEPLDKWGELTYKFKTKFD